MNFEERGGVLGVLKVDDARGVGDVVVALGIVNEGLSGADGGVSVLVGIGEVRGLGVVLGGVDAVELRLNVVGLGGVLGVATGAGGTTGSDFFSLVVPVGC